MRFCGRATDTEAPWHCPRSCSCTAVSTPRDCWDPTVDEIHRQAPELAVLAVDLPGRRGKPGDLTTATIGDWVDSLLVRHRGRGPRRVRHRRPFDGGAHRSRRGDEARGVAGAGDGVWPRRSSRREGAAVVDTLPGLVGWYARRKADTGRSGTLPNVVGGVCVLQRDDAPAAQVQPRSVLRRVAVHHLRERRPLGNARRRAAHLDPHAARPRAVGEVAAHDRSPRSAACRRSSRSTPATT